MAAEIELKFDVDPARVAAAREAIARLSESGPRSGQLESRYFDTPEHSLRAAGYSLRVRRHGDSYTHTIKRRSAGCAGLFVREEQERPVGGFDLSRAELISPELEPILAGVDRSPTPLFSVSFTRIEWSIARYRSRIDAFLDVGCVKIGNREALFCELELELVSGTRGALFRVAGLIAAEVPLRLAVRSKAERGYALVQNRLGRVVKAERAMLDTALTKAQAFRLLAVECFRHYRLNEIVLMEMRRPGALRQMRIALRRLRSLFTLFRRSLRGDEFRSIREGLRDLGRLLGAARDLDVFVKRTSDAGNVHGELRRARELAYKRVDAAIASPRSRELMLRLAAWIEATVDRIQACPPHDLNQFMGERLDKQWKKIRKQGSHIPALDPRARHTLRLDIMRMRYAAEFTAGLYDGEFVSARRDRFIAALRSFQRSLGELHDDQVAIRLAARFGLPPARSRVPSDRAIAEAQRGMDRAIGEAGYWLRSPGEHIRSQVTY